MKQFSVNTNEDAERMNKIIIRRTTESDLDGIRDLSNESNSYPDALHHDKNLQLKWLLMDTDMNNSFRSFVAVDDKKVIGHIGYVRSYYHYRSEKYVGVHPITWNVEEKYRGLLGLNLLSNAMKDCDFNIIIGGTEMAQKIYRSLNFNLLTHATKFVKVLKHLKYYKIMDGSLPIRIAKTIYHSRGILKKRRISLSKGSDATVELVADIHKFKYEIDDSVMANIPNEKHIDWILSCPDVKTYAFSIRAEHGTCGFAICYTQKTANDILVGRIVHISNLGSELKLWHQVIFLLEKFLRIKRCATISILATYPVLIRALNQSGYLSKVKSPVWIKGNVTDIPLVSWHLTYLEGDLSYRGLF